MFLASPASTDQHKSISHPHAWCRCPHSGCNVHIQDADVHMHDADVHINYDNICIKHVDVHRDHTVDTWGCFLQFYLLASSCRQLIFGLIKICKMKDSMNSTLLNCTLATPNRISIFKLVLVELIQKPLPRWKCLQCTNGHVPKFCWELSFCLYGGPHLASQWVVTVCICVMGKKSTPDTPRWGLHKKFWKAKWFGAATWVIK